VKANKMTHCRQQTGYLSKRNSSEDHSSNNIHSDCSTSSFIHDDKERSFSSDNENNDATADQSTYNLPVPPSHKQLRRRLSIIKSIHNSDKRDSFTEVRYVSNNSSRSGSESESPSTPNSIDSSGGSNSMIITKNETRSWTFDRLLVPSICVTFGVIIWFLCFVYRREDTIMPSLVPSVAFSSLPSYGPSAIPSKLFSPTPSYAPSPPPTFIPTIVLSNAPSKIHSMSPSNMPSLSKSPSQEPSPIPTSSPSKDFAWDQFGETLYGKKGLKYYGFSMALSKYGRHLAIAQHQDNRIDIYFRLDGQWIQANASITGVVDNNLGIRVAIADEGVRVASLEYDSLNTVGMARVWDFSDDGDWIQKGQTVNFSFGAVNVWGFLGQSLALSASGEDVIIANSFYSPVDSIEDGEVRVMCYNADEGKWIRRGDIITSAKLSESKIKVKYESVSITDDGDYIAFGTTGRVFVECFRWDENGNNWIKLGNDIGIVPLDKVMSGDAVELTKRDDGILVLAVLVNAMSAMYVYEWDGNNWSQRGSSIDCKAWFSLALSDNGDTIIIEDSKEAVVFDWDGINWIRRGESIYQWNPDQGDSNGAVEISGDGNIVVVGDPYLEGHVQSFAWRRPK
jgi:hypothetical protein